MEISVNKKTLIFIAFSLLIWMTGIVLTPVLAKSSISAIVKFSSFLYFFYQPVCHQIIDRSFLIDTMPMTVCVRCFSVYFAGWLLTIFYLSQNSVRLWSIRRYIVLLMPLLFDIALEKLQIYANVPWIRFLSGMLLGIVIFHLLILSTVTTQHHRRTKYIKF